MAIAVHPAEPRATIDACHIVVTGADPQRPPDGTGGPYAYELVATSPSWDGKRLDSHDFNVAADGEHRWDGLIFPAPGTWTIDLVDTENDEAVIDTTEVVVV